MLKDFGHIPALPATWLPILAALVLLAGVVVSVRSVKAAGPNPDPESGGVAAIAGTPMLVAAGLVALLWVWSRNPITLHSYGFFLVVGFFLATWNACMEARRRGYDPNIILDMAMPMLVATVAMCRVLYIILNPHEFKNFGEMLSIWGGGLSFHGSLVAAPMVIAYFAWSRKVPFTTLCDIVAPSVFLGYVFGRIGCFLNGCCYGSVCELPWAVHFPNLVNDPATALRHPTQLYSAILAFGLFVFMQRAKLKPAFNRFPGQMSLLFFALYAVERGFIEIFRAGSTAETVFGTDWLTQAQVASIAALVVIAVVWTVKTRRAPLQPVPPAGPLLPHP